MRSWLGHPQLLIRLGAIITAALLATAPARADEAYPIRRTVRYHITVSNPTAEAVRNAELRVYAPVRQTATQLTLDLKASQAFQVIGDDLGNQALSFRVDLPPYAAKAISVEAAVGFAKEPLPAQLTNAAAQTRAERFIEVDDPQIQDAARALGGSGSDDVARRAYEWVADHVAESGYVAEDRGALEALKTAKGDCTESMYLFVALARARQIPARGLEGFVIHGDAVLKPDDYHNWAEFYAAGTWHLADPQQRVWRKAQDYLAMRIIGPGEPGVLHNNRRFETTHPTLKVRME